MQTAAQVVDNIKLNLSDLRMQGVCLFIQAFIERKVDVGGPIARYRIFDEASGVFVTSVDEFITSLRGDSVVMSYPFGSARFDTDRVVGYNVRIENLHVRFDANSTEDAAFDEIYGFHHRPDATYKFQFYMAYMNDGDTNMEVKISSIRLVSQ